MSVLELKEIYKIFGSGHGHIALKNINLVLDKGEFAAVMGPSGSGKTTLMNVTSTVMKASSGKVIIDGLDMEHLNEEELAVIRREKVGFVFQDFRLIDNLNVRENIILPLVLKGLKANEIDNKLNRIKDILNLEDIVNKKSIYELSGGQKQKIAIARAIIHEPLMLFADEPTGKLDSDSANNIMNLFQAINKNFHMSIIMVTHNPLSASFCDRVLFLRDGEIYNEIYKGEEKNNFHKRILDVVAFLGGKTYDL
ncbi:ABC transporter ATP-binding protein [Clostridium ganghwense]|uniref:ABC transporter ATP-binding protein n=1 Tax=Clostridium ganghwense TaxID=312089 RepID=A0ABT4CRP6_9CLOT|nr:ABC transporter ATP-binding protein [Clostridium ganghwense]MCY6371709.1 ABC transporter ATP-binding protein [Clostridium ganghwense]